MRYKSIFSMVRRPVLIVMLMGSDRQIIMGCVLSHIHNVPLGRMEQKHLYVYANVFVHLFARVSVCVLIGRCFCACPSRSIYVQAYRTVNGSRCVYKPTRVYLPMRMSPCLSSHLRTCVSAFALVTSGYHDQSTSRREGINYFVSITWERFCVTLPGDGVLLQLLRANTGTEHSQYIIFHIF